jgi:probable phosphoglycerate mutase
VSDALTLFLVRHGQTECSRENRFCGSGLDVPLLPVGEEMAHALAERYESLRWEAVYSSPARRARQTAEPLARRAGLDVRIDESLREIAYGEWEGLLEHEVRALSPRAFADWLRDPGRFAPPGGESGADIAVRSLAAVDAIRERHRGGNVMAVSHKATIRVLVCALLGLDVGLYRARIGQPVCAVTIFEFREGGPLMRAMGDTSHLPARLRSEPHA